MLTRKTGSRIGDIYPYCAGHKKKPCPLPTYWTLVFHMKQKPQASGEVERNLPRKGFSASREILEAKAIFFWEGWKPLYLALGIAKLSPRNRPKKNPSSM